MISQLNVRTHSSPASKSAASSLDEAITNAETGSFHLKAAYQSTKDSYLTLDGYQPAATDIARDTPWRDVSPSGRSLHSRADSSTSSAQNADNSGYSAESFLEFAVQSLDQAIPDLSGAQRNEALKARRGLSQGENRWHTNVALGNALATMNGGALPYIESAEADSPGQDVSWAGGEIYGNLRDTLGHLNEAGHWANGSINEVQSAIATLRSLREQVSAG